MYVISYDIIKWDVHMKAGVSLRYVHILLIETLILPIKFMWEFYLTAATEKAG